MLATFVIGLREGIEAALIVGMIAAYLTRRGSRRTLGQMWLGVAAAVAVSLAVGIGLQIGSASLPERQSEIFATVIGVVAVGVVTYMAVWMRQHARELKGQLEGSAEAALERGSALGLVAMAFFAVLREGFETAVFLVAIFANSGSPLVAFLGALLGLLAAAVLGYGLYSGGVRLDIGKFFRVTGVVLVLVAAGLLVNTLASAAEAELIGFGQERALDLSGFVRPGSALGALLTGVLGVQPYPTVLQTIVWPLYAIPLLLYVGWPRSRAGATSSARSARFTRLALPVAIAVVPALVAAGAFATAGTEEAAQTRSVTGSGPVANVVIRLTDAGCAPDPATVGAGAVTFTVRNDGSNRVTEAELIAGSRTLGEKENLTPGLSASFTLRLASGDYTVACPGGTDDSASFTVTGSATAARELPAPLRRATAGYRNYVVDQVDRFVGATSAFAAAVRAGRIAEAKRRYAPARVFYERIEPVAETFGGLDPAIDARINDVADPSRWTGFHPLERALWIRRSLAGQGPAADRLVADARTLRERVATTTYQPAELANGSVALLEEVVKNKITGEEDRYSHTDLTNLVANVQGAHKAFDLLAPSVRDQDSRLAAAIEQRFAATRRALARFRDPAGYGGWVDYSTVRPGQRRALATVVDALAEPLSQVATLVV